MFGNSKFSRNRQKQQNPVQLTPRTIWTFRVAVALAALCGIVLLALITFNSPAWGREFPENVAPSLQQVEAPQTMGGAFGGLEKYLALLAATCTVLAIIIPNHAVPKTYIANAVTGGLSAFGAVAGTFDPSTFREALMILIIASPVLVAITITWRLPQSFWEFITWIFITSIMALLMVLIIINTKIGLLMVLLLGQNMVFIIMASIVGIAGTLLLVTWLALVVKARGMMERDYNWDRWRIG